MKPYKILNDEWIELTEGPYEGIVYKYGRVELIDEDDHMRVKFEYQLDDGSKMDNQFVQYIGPILIDLIEEKSIGHSLIFTGGTDENRTKDPD